MNNKIYHSYLRESFEITRAIIQSLVIFGVGIWFIIVYSLYNDQPCAKPISTFLLASGISQVVFLFISFISTFVLKIGVKSDKKSSDSNIGYQINLKN